VLPLSALAQVSCNSSSLTDCSALSAEVAAADFAKRGNIDRTQLAAAGQRIAQIGEMAGTSNHDQVARLCTRQRGANRFADIEDRL
jgi:hypothetical protein